MTTRRRGPRSARQQHADWTRALIPGFTGVRNATPIVPGLFAGRAEARAVGAASSGGAGGSVLAHQDVFELSADGAQSQQLTYLPLTSSEHVYLNGLYQRQVDDWTRIDRAVNVQAAMDARAGDVLTVEYLYASGVPVAPTDGVADTFDRADTGSSLTVSSSGQTWLANVGTWGVSGNRGYTSSATTGAARIATIESGLSDGTFQVVVDVSVDAGLVFRCNGGTDFLYVQLNAVGGHPVQLVKSVGNVDTVLATVDLGAVSGVHTLRVVAAGASLTVSVDGTQRIAHTLSAADQTTYGSLTRIGLRQSGSGSFFNDLLVTP